jgi:hypothetical protein
MAPGKTIETNRLPKSVYENAGSYFVTNEIFYDGKMKPAPSGMNYIMIMTTFEAGDERDFTVRIWYKKEQGSIKVAQLK